jgi:MFS family permease
MAESNALRIADHSAPIYYGWWVLCATALTEMLAIGSTSYAAGLFVLPLEHDLGLSRADASSSIPILFTGGALMSLLVGYLLDRFAVQRIISVGAIAFGGGLVLIAATSSVWVMALALFIPVAFGFMAIGPLTTTTLVSRWFYRRRGRALGLATVATSGGGIVVVPLLSWAIQAYGWRSALFAEALLISSVVIVLSTFLIRSGPADLSLVDHPENKGRSATDMPQPVGAAGATSQQPRWRLYQILTTWNFWAVAVAIAAITAVSQAIVVTIVPYATELGFLPGSVAFLITAFSISAAIVKVGSGILAEYIDQRIIMLASALAMIASLLLLLNFSDYSMLIIACCLAGTSLGCILPSSAVLVASCFGSPSFGTVMGAVYVAIGISSIASVRFVGAVFDRTGNYREAFITFMVLSGIAALGSLMVRPPRSVAFSPEITPRAS